MFKIVISICLLVSISFAAEESTYVFEAKGKFAEELKTLLEKYSKDGHIDVKVLKLSDSKKNGGIMSALLASGNDNADIDRGQKIYNSNCFKCHGINAKESSYANARVLSTLSKEELINQIENYKMSPSYGGSTKFVMNNAVETVNSRDIESVVEYILNIDKKSTKQINKSTNTKPNTASTSYLK